MQRRAKRIANSSVVRLESTKIKAETKVMNRVKETEDGEGGRRINMVAIIQDRKDQHSLQQRQSLVVSTPRHMREGL